MGLFKMLSEWLSAFNLPKSEFLWTWLSWLRDEPCHTAHLYNLPSSSNESKLNFPLKNPKIQFLWIPAAIRQTTFREMWLPIVLAEPQAISVPELFNIRLEPL